LTASVLSVTVPVMVPAPKVKVPSAVPDSTPPVATRRA
jgi:hypothetical protein